jgi:transcriptional regulator with XRE-family HTH domain
MKTFSSIADVIAAARKDRRLSQEQIAEALGIHQATYSRFENGISIPTIAQWDDLCRALKIPYDAGRYKLIDRLKPLSGMPAKTRLSKSVPGEYQEENCIKVRYLLPMINYVHQTLGAEAFENAISRLGFEKAFFINIDHELNLRFLSAFIDSLGLSGTSGPAVLPQISELVRKPESHASLSDVYLRSLSKAELLTSFSENQKYYQSFYDLRLSCNENVVRVTIKHDEKLKKALLDLPYKTLLFISEYALLSLNNITGFADHGSGPVTRNTIVKSDDLLNPGVFEMALA